jgi:NAD+ kinase
MKVAIVSDHQEMAKHLLEEHGGFFELVEKDPEMVISFGGDGTFFRADFLFPHVPKVYLKYSHIGKLAIKKDNEAILGHIVRGEYTIAHKTRLDIVYNERVLTALGDALVHNKNPRTAIRTKVFIDDVLIQDEDVIGDGLLVSTQLGSTGYYKSITRSYFESDDQIGLAFNNAIDQINHIVLRKNRVIKVFVTRGVAQVFADNQEECLEVDTGGVFEIRASRHLAQMVEIT